MINFLRRNILKNKFLPSQLHRQHNYLQQIYTNTSCLSRRNNQSTTDIEEDNNQIITYNSKVGIVTHPCCLTHEIEGHPESPQRLKSILDSLNNPENTDEIWSQNLKMFDNPTQITRSMI
eukprot:392473_1